MTRYKNIWLFNHDVKVINRIVNSKTSVTAEMALKLAYTFNTSPEFWLNAQNALNLYKAIEDLEYDLPDMLKEAS